MTMDDWVQSALTDDSIVVELLFRLKRTWPQPPLVKPPAAVLPPPGWGHRHPRSKPGSSTKKEREPTRCSPTTPLSWSGGGGAAASVSDDYEEFSLASDPYRSKGTFANESPTATTNIKRSRKKKTFMELKEEENLLLKERTHLKKELASLRISLKEERDRGDNLKRIKLDCHQKSPNNIGARPVGPIDPSPIDHNRPILQRLDALSSCSSIQKQSQVDSKTCFVLPDLNMPPSEDDFTR